jgi:two-component sensor histidine kinase
VGKIACGTVAARDGAAHYIMRALPYWTGSSRIEGATVTFIDVTGLAQAEEQLRVMVAELNHRVKNMLTVIVSIAAQTLKRSSDTESFAKTFLDRLHAMARSHVLLSRELWSEISLRDVIAQEIEPYRHDRGDREAIEGPPVSLTPKRALSLGMVIHELGTNSVKYRSLSAADGSIENHLGTRETQRELPGVGMDRARRSAGCYAAAAWIRPKLDRARSQPKPRGKARIEFAGDGLRVNLRISLEAG